VTHEPWALSEDGQVELAPVLDWETGIADHHKDAILRIWFQVGREQCNEDVQLQLTPFQVKELRAALERLERDLAQSSAN
jgi:hypothetical protein